MFGEKKQINKSLLLGIGNSAIPMNKKAVLPLSEAFDNLQKHMKNEPIPPTYPTDGRPVEEIFIPIICPDFDPDGFKVYHARKVMKWYNYLIEGVRKSNEYK